VIDLEDGVDPFKVRVTIEDEGSGAERPLAQDEAGADISFENGESFIDVDEGRMYLAVSLQDVASRELKFSSNSANFGLYTMTFGAYESVD
jgi:hypothetical protein